jgi:hypothetical protein
MFEEMPIPQNGDEDFAIWLVPARNNIQRQLLRLQLIVGRPSKAESLPLRSDAGWVAGWLLGVGFSLWRAVFQAGHALDRDHNFERGRIFLNEIIRNNAAAYSTELNSWSLGYYLNNARFRLIAAHGRIIKIEQTKELGALIEKIRISLDGEQGSAPHEWVLCFHALRQMIDILERQRSGSKP